MPLMHTQDYQKTFAKLRAAIPRVIFSIFFLFLSSIALAQPSPNGETGAKLPDLEGWGPFKFSMSFSEALTAAGKDAWTSLDVGSPVIHYRFKLGGVPKEATVSFILKHMTPTSINIKLSQAGPVGNAACKKLADSFFSTT